MQCDCKLRSETVTLVSVKCEVYVGGDAKRMNTIRAEGAPTKDVSEYEKLFFVSIINGLAIVDVRPR